MPSSAAVLTVINATMRVKEMATRNDVQAHAAQEYDPLFFAEFCCWTMLVLAPFLYWVNGPAVSTDQLVVRTTLTILAAIGAVVLRVVKICRGRKRRRLLAENDEDRAGTEEQATRENNA